MTRSHLARILAPLVAICALAVAAPPAAQAGHSAARSALSHLAAPAIVVSFGREGGNIRPLTVAIDANGTVTGGATAHLQLSRDAVDGLLKLATAEGFFTMPGRMIGHGLPDIGGRFITIRTAGKTKSVHIRFVRNAAFDQLYAVLSAAVGIPT